MSTLNSERWLPAAAIVLGLGVAGSVATLVYQHGQLVNARVEVAGLRREMSVVRQDIGTAESRLREKVEALNGELAATRKQTEQAQQIVDRARVAVRKQAEALVSKAAVSQERQRQQMAAELDSIKYTADQASVRLTDIGSEVGEVKTEVGEVKTLVASTRSELDKTIAEMRRVNGDMGVMSGLVATNSKEIAALRALGERDYYEFSLGKTQARRLLAGVNLVYKKADPKRNRYTLEVVADDKRVEKKDRTINEPVQFYVPSKARQPYELVINEIRKDTIVGYLSAPKTQVAQR
jgi:chromosome segregation ATPase